MKDLERVLAESISKKTGLPVGEDNVHVASRRYYYIPEARENHPLFLHHYRGPFFLEIPGEDWKKMDEEKISVDEYINGAFWSFGYYWGGGYMISGGYFTPLEEGPGIHDKKLIQRVMTAIYYEGCHQASGYQMSDEQKEEWKQVKELFLHDARVDFFNQLNELVKEKYGYELHGLYSWGGLEKEEVEIYANIWERTFRVNISDDLVRNLLYHTETADVVADVKLYIASDPKNYKYPISSNEDFQEALDALHIIANWETYEERERELKERKMDTANHPEENDMVKSWFQKLLEIFVK